METAKFNGFTPCYILDTDKVKENYHSLVCAFSRYYNNVRIAYSYKTNYTPAICRLTHDLGCYSEVVSPMELCAAHENGVSCEDIIYNGVAEDYQSQFLAAANGSKVNIDSYRQFVWLKEKAERLKIHIKLGIRVNFPIGTGYTSRFGIPVSSEEYRKVLDEAEASEYVTIAGLHCHFSFARDIGSWTTRAQGMIDVARGMELEYIDLGGNMYGSMPEELSEQFGNNIPSFEDYAEAIAPLFAEAYPDGKTQLILETGTPMIANAVSVLSTVKNKKEVEGQMFILMDTSSFDIGALAKTRNVPITVYRNNKAIGSSDAVYDAKLVGCTCLEEDVLRRWCPRDIEIGDIVEFHNVGAYSLTMNSNFIKPVIPMYTKDGTCLRRGTTSMGAFSDFVTRGDTQWNL